MLTYGWGSTDFFDKNRAQNGVVVNDKYTGKADTSMLSLGGYSTWYAKNGTYLDLVGNLSWLHNKYRSRDGLSASQNGYGLGLSAEVGRPWRIGESQWQIEPQAQLSYQRIHLNSFNDGVRNRQRPEHGWSARAYRRSPGLECPGRRVTYQELLPDGQPAA